MAEITVDDLAAMIANQFSGQNEMLERRFSGIDKRFDGVDERFDGVEQKLINLEQGQSVIQKDIKTLKQGQEDISVRLDIVRYSDVSSMEKRVSVLEKDVKILKTARC